jgi:hypothetical protein
MNYMPTKSRKWLAGAIATTMVASLVSMFAAVAPASALNGSGVMTVTTSKAIRATDTLAAGHTTGTGTGVAVNNIPSVVVTFDDTLGETFIRAGGKLAGTTTAYAEANEAKLPLALRLVVTLRSLPSSTASLQVDDTADAASLTNLALNTPTIIDDSKLRTSRGLVTKTNEDTGLSFAIVADEPGTYTMDIFLDADQDLVQDAGEPTGSASIIVYGTPTLTASGANSTQVANSDDTITLTLTGGALSAQEEFAVYTDGSMSAVTLYTYFDVADRQNTDSVQSRQVTQSVSDTLVIDDSMSWRWSANVATVDMVVAIGASDDLVGGLRIRSIAGNHVSAITITFAATTLKSDIAAAWLTAPTTNINPVPTVDDDTYDTNSTTDGQYAYDIKTGSSALVVAGGFQLNSAANYGGSVVVSLYGAANPTNANTPLFSSTVVTTAAGSGTFSFTVPNLEIDVADEVVVVTIGGVDEDNLLTAPKQIVLTAKTATPVPTYTVGDYTWKSSVNKAVTRLNAAAASTVTASVAVKDQFGNALTGYHFKMTTSAAASTARNAGVLKEALVSATGTATLTYVDAGTTLTDDTLTLSILNATKDETTTGTYNTMTVNFSTATLSGYLVNGETAAERVTNGYVSNVPGLGYSTPWGSLASNQDDSTNLNQVKVTVAGVGTTAVKFTGSAGVRFARTSTDLPNDAGVGTANVNHDKGSTMVYAVPSAGVATAYFFCITAGDCTVTASVGSVTSSGAIAYQTDAAYARTISDIKINDAAATSGTSSADKKVKVSFKVTDVFGNPVKTLGQANVAVDFIVSGVGSLDGFGNQGSLKTAADGTAIFYAMSSAAGLQQITLDGAGGAFDALASSTYNTPKGDAVKTVALTWSAAPAPEVVYAAPTLTVTKSGNKIILDGTAVEGEGDIIVYIKRVGTTKWVEQAATIEVAAPGDYNGMRVAPKSNVLIRVKQEGTGKFSNQVVVLK